MWKRCGGEAEWPVAECAAAGQAISAATSPNVTAVAERRSPAVIAPPPVTGRADRMTFLER